MESLMSQQAAAQLLVLEEGEATAAQLQEAREDPLLESDAYELEMELYSKLFSLQPVKEVGGPTRGERVMEVGLRHGVREMESSAWKLYSKLCAVCPRTQTHTRARTVVGVSSFPLLSSPSFSPPLFRQPFLS